MNRRSAFVAAVSSAASVLAWLLFRAGFSEVLFDAVHYVILSQIISTEGLWNLASRIRTYGYPLFISLVTGFSVPAPGTARAVVAAAQVVVYLATCFYIARVTERVFGDRKLFYGTFAVLALNPIALIHATELLSDLLSAALVAIALFASLEKGQPSRRAFLAFLAAGFAVAVRPANIVLLPALGLVWLLRARRYAEPLFRSLGLGGLAVACALAPQLQSNVRVYDRWTPLLVDPLYASQTHWGIAILKYGTLVVPGRPPQLVYGNPLRPEAILTPLGFWRHRPLGYVATLALHGFAMVDQDLPFTYITDTKPWYRWPLSLANYAFLFLAAVGLALLLARASPRASPAGLYAWGALLFSAALVAIYLPVAVENRFSLPLYPILTPAAVFAVCWAASQRTGTIVAVAIAGGGFVAACVQVSLFLTKQAPSLAGP